MHPTRVLVAVALAFLVAPEAGAQAADAAPPEGDGWLWLAAPEPFVPLPNFSADPPELPASVGVAPAPIRAGSGEIVWKWVMPRLPEEWSVPADTTFTVDLVFSGLDRALPVLDVESETGRVGRFEIRVDVLHWSSDQGVASGFRYLAPELPGGDHVRPVTVEAKTSDAVHYGVAPGKAPLFGVKVTLTGFAQNDDPPLLVLGDEEHPARLHAPGFPVDALRSWDDATAEAAACNARVLQQLPCDATTAAARAGDNVSEQVAPASPDVEAHEAAGAGWLFAMVALAVVARRVRGG